MPKFVQLTPLVFVDDLDWYLNLFSRIGFHKAVRTNDYSHVFREYVAFA